MILNHLCVEMVIFDALIVLISVMIPLRTIAIILGELISRINLFLSPQNVLMVMI